MVETQVETPRKGERLMEFAGVAGFVISLLSLVLQFSESKSNSARDDRMEKIEVENQQLALNLAERDRIERIPGVAFTHVKIGYDLVGGGLLNELAYDGHEFELVNICKQPLLDLKLTWSADPIDFLGAGVSTAKELREVGETMPSTLLPMEKSKIAKLPNWMYNAGSGQEDIWRRVRLEVSGKGKNGELLHENFIFESRHEDPVFKVQVFREDKDAHDWTRNSFYAP